MPGSGRERGAVSERARAQPAARAAPTSRASLAPVSRQRTTTPPAHGDGPSPPTTRDRLAAAFGGEPSLAGEAASADGTAEPVAVEESAAPAQLTRARILRRALPDASAAEAAPAAAETAPAPAAAAAPLPAQGQAPAAPPAPARAATAVPTPARSAAGVPAPARSAVGASAATGPLRDAPAADADVATTAHASRPGEAAAAPVEPEPGAELELGLERGAALAATLGAAGLRRSGARGAPGDGDGGAPGGPRGPRAWPAPPRAVIRTGGRPSPIDEAVVPWREVEAHARGPPLAEQAHPKPTTVDETADARRTGPELWAVPGFFTLMPAPAIQAKLAVSSPGDACEVQADAVAARVLSGARPRPPVTTTGSAGLARAPPRQRGPPPAGFPASVGAALQSGGGRPLDRGLRRRVEPHVGIDLTDVRVRQDPLAAAAARDIQARAFTSGSTIFLAPGASAADVGLMAHEATHVAQQGSSAVARATLMRDFSVTDLIPDSILEAVRSTVRAIPGYQLLSTIVGADLLTGEPAQTSREELVETLLTYGPFGAAVGPLLSAIDVLGDIVAVITEGLAANNLSLDRIKRDIDTAWDEFTLEGGISGNAAIVARLVGALLSDVASFVSSIVDRVIEIVRAVVAEVAEPLLETPEFKPIWDLTKKVLHYDPLRGESVDADTVDIVADFLTLIGEEERLAQMRERGTLQETADWLDTQLATFQSLIGELGGLFSEAWAAIQPENLPNLLTNLEALAGRAIGFVGRVVDFGVTLIVQILELIKDSLLGWLSENAHSIPGFRLLTVILERNPFTDEPVERTAVNLIRGFITLLPNGEETYDKLAEAGVIDDAAGRIETAMTRPRDLLGPRHRDLRRHLGHADARRPARPDRRLRPHPRPVRRAAVAPHRVRDRRHPGRPGR